MILKNGKRIDGCTDTLPVGTVQPFLGLTPPLGYLVCQGQLINKIEYPELYKICGSTFGAETDTHFYLPDLRGKTIAGYDSNNASMNSIGKILGEEKHNHLTPLSWYTNDDKYYLGTTNFYGAKNVDYGDLYGNEVTVRGSYPSTSTNRLNYYTDYQSNYQPTITMNWIVKAAMLIPGYFTVENTLESTSASNALSAAQGKTLNGKFANYLPLNGGNMNGEISIGQGDGYGIQLGTNGRINATLDGATNATVLGVLDANTVIGHTSAPLSLRGKNSAPSYNGVALVESGSNSNGSYIKLIDGTMICYHTKSISVDCTSQWGQLYEGGAAVGSLPTSFISAPMVIVTNTSPDGYFEGIRDTTKTTWGTLRMAIPTSATRTFVVNFLAIGRWK